MTIVYTIICVLGSVASIVGVVLTIKRTNKNQNIINRTLYFIIFCLSVFAAISYYKYKEETDKQLDFELRKQNAQIEAQAILNTLPNYISEYEPGINEGIFFSVLFFLEKNKTLWPDAYESFKKNLEQVIDMYNKESDRYKKNEIMESSANQAVILMKSLAQ
jgi:hypothetical protein